MIHTESLTLNNDKNMRKMLLSLMLLPLTLMADNYFANGMEWTEMASFHEEEFPYLPSTYIQHVKVDGDTIVDGVEAMKVYATDPYGNYYINAIIRVDGDKVYTLNNYETNQWYLAYDFSLEIDDECYFSNFDTYTQKFRPMVYHYVCTGKYLSEDYGGWPVLQLEEVSTINPEDYGFEVGKGEWLIGIGNTHGVDLNYFTSTLIGGGGRLLSASFNGNQLCKYSTDYIGDVEMADVSIKIAQTGDKSLTISNLAAGDQISIYDMTGRSVFSQSTTGDNICINLPQKGVYIIKSNACSKAKILNIR